ncbi:Mdm33 family-domain-containing protein [Hygrophoropsis aurantiaca]|uniref:Mdm33 family-domain-containing protein n=1 Tax=Hygrophoropsis aurantiaca TaxID=72124 RepID=A0ACB8ABJ5_9AGAM|nr:Mdm33 family-domain-containing protein [Hygrophoropsis aurantiaca]
MLRNNVLRPAVLRSFSTSHLIRNTPNFIERQTKPDENPPADTPPPLGIPPSEPITHHTGKQRDSPPYDLNTVKERLKDWSTVASTVVRRRVDDLTVKTSTTFSQLGSHLNRVTGYEEIEALKNQVVGQEARIKSTRQAAREAKTAHDEAVVQRSISQREVNDLLQRKSSWTDTDVSRFTSLVRSDHLYEQDEARAKARVAETEDAVDREFSELMRAILARYHEEQVWSDKIRSASTYGSLTVLGINLLVFIMAIVVVEPWKRRRLAQTFERKVEEMGVENRAVVEDGTSRLEKRLVEQEKLLAGILVQSTYAREEIPETPMMAATQTDFIPEGTFNKHLPASINSIFETWGQRELLVGASSAIAGGAIALIAQGLFRS